MAEGGVALLHAFDRVFHQLLLGPARGVVVNAHLVPALAAEQAVDRDIEILACNVVKRDVDGGHGAHDRRAAEVGIAVQVLPVVFDIQRIFPDQILPHGQDRLGRGFQEAPGPALAEADDSLVGIDLAIHCAVCAQNLDISNLHSLMLTLHGRAPLRRS